MTGIKNLSEYFSQFKNLNFQGAPEAPHVTVTYNTKYLPESIKQTRKEIANYLCRSWCTSSRSNPKFKK